MALIEMPFPEILKDHYGTDAVSVEKLTADLDTWSEWVYASEDYPEVDFDELGPAYPGCLHLSHLEGRQEAPALRTAF